MSKTKAKPAWLVTNSGSVVIYTNGKVYSADATHSNYKAILAKVKTGKFGNLDKLFDVGKTIEKRSRGTWKVENGQVFFGGKPVHNYCTERIVYFMRADLPFKPLVNFLRNCPKDGPDSSFAEQLYRFMEANQLPVTWDGYVLAYKGVQEDYTDYRTSKVKYTVGSSPEMPREAVELNPNKACGRGLHVGGLDYVKQYYGGKHVMICKVHPNDVISVPVDYSSGKCRACKVTVLSEFDLDSLPLDQKEAIQRGGYGNTCTMEDDDMYDPEDDDDDDDYDDDEDEEYDVDVV